MLSSAWHRAAGGALALCALGCQPAQPTEPPAMTGSSATAASVPAPSAVARAASTPAAGSAAAAGSGHTITITGEQGRAAGLPAIGFTISGIWSGFAVNRRPSASTYLSLAGPPGGVLMLVVKPYHGTEPSVSFLEQLFEEWSRTMPGLQPVTKGRAEKLVIAGAERDAIGYLGGSGPGRASWCVTLVPATAAQDEDQGLMILMGVAAAAAAQPSCRHAAEHPQIKPLIEHFRLTD